MARPYEFDPDVAIDRAMEVFWRQGYAGTTPQDLLDATGIGKGSFYNRFKSKHKMFELCLLRYRQSQADALVQFLKQPGPAKERLRKALQTLIAFDLEGPVRKGCLAVNTAAELATSDVGAARIVGEMFDRTSPLSFSWSKTVKRVASSAATSTHALWRACYSPSSWGYA